MSAFIFFFFFQAEDGIRDLTVTGVQTCALPIAARRDWRSFPRRSARGDLPAVALRAGSRSTAPDRSARSGVSGQTRLLLGLFGPITLGRGALFSPRSVEADQVPE